MVEVKDKIDVCPACRHHLEEAYPVVWNGKLYHQKCYDRIVRKK